MPRKPAEFNVRVGMRLEQLRGAHELKSMRAFAQKLGVNEDTYRAWAKGDNGLPALKALVLCDRYDATWGWIYGGDDRDLPRWLRDKIRDQTA